MSKPSIVELAKSQLVYLDGATGSNLLKRGMPAGVCPELWTLENQDVLIGLQREYIAAGSHVIYAPTFTGNRIKLKHYGLEKRIEEINKGLVNISREAAAGKAFVAGNLSMTGVQVKPVGHFEFEELVDVYKEQVSYLVSAGVDLIAIETMMSLQETRAAVIAAKETCNLPVLATMTFEKDGRTLYGTDAKTAAVVLSSLGADIVGANCSTGPDKMYGIIKDMREACDVPIACKPNAGIPYLDENGDTGYDMDAQDFAAHMKKIQELGVTLLGGCCGTAPEYIKELVQSTDGSQLVKRQNRPACKLASERSLVSFHLDDSFVLVGERINPTGKKELQRQLKEGNMNLVTTMAQEQETAGAAILDVNVGMSGIDEKNVMLEVIDEVTMATSLPLVIDSSDPEVIEAALRRYPGRGLINSISAEKGKMSQLLALAKKYGAMFILLPLDDSGFPADQAEKIKIIEHVCAAALQAGLKKEDIIVDGLVTAVAVNEQAAVETIETIRYCKENGLASICGLSNISFGLPERSNINYAFLMMAIQNGLTMAIANPMDRQMMGNILSADYLLGKQDSAKHYLDYVSRTKAEDAENAVRMKAEPDAGQVNAGQVYAINTGEAESVDKLAIITKCVINGNKKGIEDAVRNALAEGIQPADILDGSLMPAINEVGALFETGIYFLPQLISGAEAMKTAVDYIEPLLAKNRQSEKKAVIVTATVKGDIHDIGKNLVALMLKNYGYHVIDLGKDMSKEAIILAAQQNNADIIALSALMTTTMQEMKAVIAYAKEHHVKSKIIIGGAVITQSYADEIGADGYSQDAQSAVKLADRLLHDKGRSE